MGEYINGLSRQQQKTWEEKKLQRLHFNVHAELEVLVTVSKMYFSLTLVINILLEILFPRLCPFLSPK